MEGYVLPSFLLGVVNAIGIFALLTMSYGTLLRRVPTPLVRSFAIGAVFGAGASLSIANAVELAPGLRVDPRAVMLVLAAPFGGTMAAIVSSVMTSIVRAIAGGAGMWPGIANIWATALVGVLFAWLVFRNGRAYSMRRLALLGLASNVPLLFILTVPNPDAVAVFMRTIGPMAAIDTLGVVIFGTFLAKEHYRVARASHLERQASTDPLTGLVNRRKMRSTITEMIATARVARTPVSVLLLDIDHFKVVNDRHGHSAGDAVLQGVADIVARSVRSVDLVARFGGEEILVALPETDAPEAVAAAERIRRTIGQTSFDIGGKACQVTVSIGVATAAGSSVSFDALFASADEAVYLAKENGRDRTEITGSSAIALAA
ncbi:diguanylate cyclase [Fulvimarina manganoxydans]|uniref:diguanylate cyclase n=2 Tax=Fulvimarina manganoxydans TaxID=937218 RepID=A0A1W1Y859_9HYPH|nr:diguanylate cyclase [Fulvimarina manganoxydans]